MSGDFIKRCRLFNPKLFLKGVNSSEPYPRDFSEITDAQLTRFIDEINIQWFPFEDPDAMADL